MKTVNEYIVAIARQDYAAGYGEVGANNSGPWIIKIMRGITGAWCTGWVCTKIDNAAKLYWDSLPGTTYEKGLQMPWLPTYTRSARNLFNQFRAAGKLLNHQIANPIMPPIKCETSSGKSIIDVPRPGDIIFFWRVSPKSWLGHVEIVESIDCLNPLKITTIGGNKGKYPAKVSRFNYQEPIEKFLGFGRI